MNFFNKALLCIAIISGSIHPSLEFSQSSAAAIIASIIDQGPSPAPYTEIQQDATTGVLVAQTATPLIGMNLTLASTTYNVTLQQPIQGVTLIPSKSTPTKTISSSPLVYIFFNVPNTFPSVNGKPSKIAGIYDEQGTLLATVQDNAYTSLLAQYGVAIDPTGIQPALTPTTNSMGSQCLGACNQQPLMFLDPADVALSPGQNGKSMIHNGNTGFPSSGITSPVTTQESQYYFYYNTIMECYFAMQVTGNIVSYINLAHGGTYNLDGSSKVLNNPVGLSSTENTTDLFLPYLTADGYVQCIMLNNNTPDSYSDYNNKQSTFIPSMADQFSGVLAGSNSLTAVNPPNNTVTVNQMPLPTTPLIPMLDVTVPTKYNVYWNTSAPVTYTINSTYQWQSLQLFPINMTSRAILNPMPDTSYARAGIILKNNAICAVIFGTQYFRATQGASANVYNLTSAKTQMSLAIKKDPTTNVAYVSIFNSSTTYDYQYSFCTLSAKQMLNYQAHSLLVGQAVTASGSTILVKNLPVDKTSGAVSLTSITMSSIQNIPSDNATQTLIAESIKNIGQDTTNNRFLTLVSPTPNAGYPFYSYLTQISYVDLATGVLFSSQGTVLGNSLQAADLQDLLTQLKITMTTNNNQAILQYAANTVATTTSSTIATHASTVQHNLLPKTSIQQLATLQKQNTDLQTDIANREAKIKSLSANTKKDPNVANSIASNKTAILMNKRQIEINDLLIPSLQKAITTASAQGTNGNNSRILGKLSSNTRKKRKRTYA